MPCAICGKEADVNDNGLCDECAEKLRRLSDASSDFAEAVQAIPIEPPTTKPKADRADAMSSVVLEFGQSDRCKLRNPFSVATDPSGNMMVMDQPERDKYRVSLFAPDGEFVRTILECGQGSGPAELKYPKGIALDTYGNLYIPDAGNDRIQRFDPQGVSLGPIGSSGEGPGEFSFPCDIEIDKAGTLHVADTYNCRVLKLTPQGVLLLSIGSAQGDADEEPELDEPMGVTVDDQGNIYVADTNHHRVVKYDPDGRLLLAFGQEGEEQGQFSYPSDVRVDDGGVIYVADKDNCRVQRFGPQGTFLAEFALGEIAQGGVAGGDVAIDDDGCVILCNLVTHTVAKVELVAPLQPPAGDSP